MPSPKISDRSAYFVKHYAGQIHPKGDHGENVRAVLYIADRCQNRDDFEHLVDLLGLPATVTRMRTEGTTGT